MGYWLHGIRQGLFKVSVYCTSLNNRHEAGTLQGECTIVYITDTVSGRDSSRCVY